MDISTVINLALYFGLVTILSGSLLFYGFRKKGILTRTNILVSSGTIMTGLGLILFATLLPMNIWIGVSIMCTGVVMIAGSFVLQMIHFHRIRRQYHD